MDIKHLSVSASIAMLTFSTATQAVLGPIPIYLNTEYRTSAPAIGSISSTLSFDSDDIEATGTNTFLDFLSTVPSVGLVTPIGNVPAVFIRGNEARHTLFLVDGVNIHDISSTDAAAGYGLSTIALNDIEKVDIIKGSGSVLYGASAVAGVISITTKKGANGKQVVASTKFGTHNAQNYAVSASSGDENSFIRFTHNQYSSDGINAQTGDSTGEEDGVEHYATQIKLGNQHHNISYLESRNKTEYDGFGGADGGELSDRKLNTVVINTTQELDDHWQMFGTLSQTKSKRDSGANAATAGDKLKSTNIALRNDIRLDGDLFNVGLSQTHIENVTDNLKHISQEVFVNWQKNITDLDVNAGVRHTKHNKFGHKSVYGLGIAKYLNNGIKLTSGYNTTFNAPSLFYLDNSPSIKPEAGKNVEIGVEKQHRYHLIGAKLFSNKVKDSIAYDGSWNGANDYENTARLATNGVELYANTLINNYDIDLSHHYADSKSNGQTTQSIRRPKNTTTISLKKNYEKFSSRLQIIKKSASLDDTTFNGVGDTKLKGYTLINASSNYIISANTELSLTIKNATNKHYTTVVGYNNPGRTIEIGLNHQF